MNVKYTLLHNNDNDDNNNNDNFPELLITFKKFTLHFTYIFEEKLKEERERGNANRMRKRQKVI